MAGGIGRFALQRQQQNEAASYENDDGGKIDAAKRNLSEKKQIAASAEASLKHATERYNDAKQQVDNAKKQADVARAQVKEEELDEDTENKDNDDSSTTAVFEGLSTPRPVNTVEDLGRDAIRRMTNGVGNFGLDNDTTAATDFGQGFSLSFDPMAAAEAAFQDFGGFNTTTDNPYDDQSPTLAVLANSAKNLMSRNANTYTDSNGDNEGAAVPTDLTEASAPTRQSRGQQTLGSKSSWPLMAQREATQRAQQNVMNAGAKRSYMSSMNNMNRTKSPGANFRPFYSGNNNSTARSFQPPSSSAKSMTIRPPMTTSNSRGIEATKSRPDNKRQKTQPSEKSYSEEIKVFVDNLDLGES